MIRGSGATTQQVSKRLQSELMTLMMSGDKVRLKKIPSEMEVAPPHKRFTQFSALIKL